MAVEGGGENSVRRSSHVAEVESRAAYAAEGGR